METNEYTPLQSSTTVQFFCRCFPYPFLSESRGIVFKSIFGYSLTFGKHIHYVIVNYDLLLSSMSGIIGSYYAEF